MHPRRRQFRIRRRHKVWLAFILAIAAGAMLGADREQVGRAQLFVGRYSLGIGSWGPVASIGCTLRPIRWTGIVTRYRTVEDLDNF